MRHAPAPVARCAADGGRDGTRSAHRGAAREPARDQCLERARLAAEAIVLTSPSRRRPARRRLRDRASVGEVSANGFSMTTWRPARERFLGERPVRFWRRHDQDGVALDAAERARGRGKPGQPSVADTHPHTSAPVDHPAETEAPGARARPLRPLPPQSPAPTCTTERPLKRTAPLRRRHTHRAPLETCDRHPLDPRRGAPRRTGPKTTVGIPAAAGARSRSSRRPDELRLPVCATATARLPRRPWSRTGPRGMVAHGRVDSRRPALELGRTPRRLAGNRAPLALSRRKPGSSSTPGLPRSRKHVSTRSRAVRGPTRPKPSVERGDARQNRSHAAIASTPRSGREP